MANNESGKITVKPDEIMTKHESWATAEAGAASDAGVRREAIGSYVEKCGFNNKAFSQFRAGLKQKTPEKRRDWLRSWEHLIEVARREILKNEPEMDLGADEDDDGVDADQPDEKDGDGGAAAEPELEEAGGEVDPADIDQLITDGEPDQETNVTPLDFGGEARA